MPEEYNFGNPENWDTPQPEDVTQNEPPNEIATINEKIDAIQNSINSLPKTETVQSIQDAISEPLDLPIGYVSSLAALLAIIEFVALIFAFVALSSAVSKIRQLSSELNNQKNAVKEMSKKFTKLEDEIHSLKSDGENQRRLNEQKFFELQNGNRFPQQPQIQTSVYNAPQNTPPDKLKNFVDDFNQLMYQISTVSPFEAKQFSNEFMRRYQIQEFSCVNFESRMNEPVPPPQFGMSKNGEFWAYEYESGIFAVVPSITVRNYRDNYHNARAMGDVFKSNFETGRTYSKIVVNRPAVFKGMWNLSEKGTLELS